MFAGNKKNPLTLAQVSLLKSMILSTSHYGIEPGIPEAAQTLELEALSTSHFDSP
jgi:hypothetical protein